MGLFNRNHMPVEGRTILMTGGSEGTGLSAARIFARKGANILIVSRNKAKLEEAISDIKTHAKSPETQRFHAISADVAEHGYAERVVAEATAWNDGQPPEIVWCLAGMSIPMLWNREDALSAARKNMDVNYFGTAEMSHAIMRAWVRPDQKTASAETRTRPATKHIIFTGSVLSTFSLAGYGTYAPSKFALRALADALVMEVRLYPEVPIAVHMVLPNSITTAGYDRENSTKAKITVQLEEADTPQSADEVAQIAVDGLEAGRYFTSTSFIGGLMRWGALSNSPRDNWFIDTIMAWLSPLIMFFVMWDMNGQVDKWAKDKKPLE